MKKVLLLIMLIGGFVLQANAFSTPRGIKLKGPSTLECPDAGAFTATVVGTNLRNNTNVKIKWEFILGNKTVTTVSTESDPSEPEISFLYRNSYTPIASTPPGTYTMKVTASWTEIYGNQYSFTDTKQVTIIKKKPDLEAYWQVPSIDFVQGRNYSFPIAIINSGAEPCGLPTKANIRVWFDLDGDETYSSDADRDILLGSGELTINKTPGSISTTNLSFTCPDIEDFDGVTSNDILVIPSISIEVDYTNSISESNENNNTDETTRTILRNANGGRIDNSVVEEILEIEEVKQESELIQVIDISGRTIWNKKGDNELNLQDLKKNEIYIFTYKNGSELTRKKILMSK